eukprot:1160744-Pelagomonas_calceolata.AAC.6
MRISKAAPLASESCVPQSALFVHLKAAPLVSESCVPQRWLKLHSSKALSLCISKALYFFDALLVYLKAVFLKAALLAHLNAALLVCLGSCVPQRCSKVKNAAHLVHLQAVEEGKIWGCFCLPSYTSLNTA